MLLISRAHAVQIDLSSESVDWYFHILEVYVLPLMVVSTIVLFCGYLASRIFHRTVSRRQDDAVERAEHFGTVEDDTEAFLRELKASPPIDDLDARREPTVEHKVRPSHPLLRRRATTTGEAPPAARERADETPPAKPLTAARGNWDRGADAPAGKRRAPIFSATPADKVEEEAPEARETRDTAQKRRDETPETREKAQKPRDETEEMQKSAKAPPLKAAFQRPRRKTADPELLRQTPSDQPRRTDPSPVIRQPEAPIPQAESSERTAPVHENGLPVNAGGESEPRETHTAEDAAAPFPVETPRASESAEADRQSRETQRREPTVMASPVVQDEPAERRREEPTISVVQSLKTAPVPPVAAAVKARAGEVVDSLDYIASVLQQGSVLLAERLKKKQGLSLEDVRGLRVSGYDEPDHVLEDLRKLGGDAAEEVLNAFAAVKAFNNIVRRLEQMAETEPLDEGWNELIRSRISETIFAVGQVRKTLGIYRRAKKRPAPPGMAQERDGDAPASDSSVPVGRRQV